LKTLALTEPLPSSKVPGAEERIPVRVDFPESTLPKTPILRLVRVELVFGESEVVSVFG
jgi:hypothetical protein